MSALLKDRQDRRNAQSPRLVRRLRICHLGKFYHPARGGIETHVRTLAKAQAELGADVRVLCVNHQDGSGRDVTWSQFTATKTVEDRDGCVRVTRIGRRASLARLDLCFGLPRVLYGLRQSGLDLLHLHTPNPTMLLALAAVRPSIPWLVTYHSDVVRQPRLGLMLRPFEHLILNRAAAILTDSPNYQAGSQMLQMYQDKVGVLPLGIDLAPYIRPSKAALEYAGRLRREHGEPLWLTVGRLVYYKGLDNAIRALAAVPGKLMIVGDGPLKRNLLGWPSMSA